MSVKWPSREKLPPVLPDYTTLTLSQLCVLMSKQIGSSPGPAATRLRKVLYEIADHGTVDGHDWKKRMKNCTEWISDVVCTDRSVLVAREIQRRAREV